jgi:hypothetical protein
MAPRRSSCGSGDPPGRTALDAEPLGDNETQIERMVLQEVVTLHPDHLTRSELSLKLAVDPKDQSEVKDIAHASNSLRASGLLRYNGDVVEPTHAAVRAAELSF